MRALPLESLFREWEFGEEDKFSPCGEKGSWDCEIVVFSGEREVGFGYDVEGVLLAVEGVLDATSP